MLSSLAMAEGGGDRTFERAFSANAKAMEQYAAARGNAAPVVPATVPKPAANAAAPASAAPAAPVTPAKPAAHAPAKPVHKPVVKPAATKPAATAPATTGGRE